MVVQKMAVVNQDIDLAAFENEYWIVVIDVQ